MSFARFRVDPEVIRVGIRREGSRWLVTVSYRESSAGGSITAWSADPETAVKRALKQAERHGMTGIDLGMDWVYRHPQRRP